MLEFIKQVIIIVVWSRDELEERGSLPDSTVLRPNLGPNHPTIQWVPGLISRGSSGKEREHGHPFYLVPRPNSSNSTNQYVSIA
jgi:hypothetical protein